MSGADIDLILLDLRMPGMNGVKGVRSLRMRRPDVPVAVISALADDFVMRECFDAGAIGYIPKRSEEHTSELQSLMRISYAVFCLTKKNTSEIQLITIIINT